MDSINQLYRKWQQEKKIKLREKIRDRLLREIWQVYHPRLQVFLSSRTACPPGDREDRASEILLRVFESLDNYNPDYAFSTWIYTIARNSQIDLLRKKGPLFAEREPRENDKSSYDRKTPEEEILRFTEASLINSAVGSLSPADRELLFLVYHEEMKYAEISRVLEMPVGTIKYNIHRIKSVLKAVLREDFEL